MARMAPITKPAIDLPNSVTESSSSSAWLKMAIIGPKMTALGDMVFIKAQINPARQKSPLPVQI